MRPTPHKLVAVFLCQTLLLLPVGCAPKRANAPRVPLAPAVFDPLQEALRKHYAELFETAPKLEFSASQIQKMREYLKSAEDYCVAQFRRRGADYESQVRQSQDQLRRVSPKINDERRKELHCRIQNARVLQGQSEVLADQGIPVAYQNKQAKLDLIEKWPAELREIRQEIAAGAQHNRRWADVKDIGFREIAPGQKDDIDDGQEAIRQMKQNGMLPPEVGNEAVRKYVTALAEKLAKRSDLQVPLKVTVLNSKEINAFALPGGFLFVQRGLLEAAEDESQLAGVLAHEIAHAAARHGHKLMKKATIASILYQAAQVAAVVVTGGVAGIGTYYALQYGFYGLGLILSLDLLGVSRDFELEADRLGVQYAWAGGYDPSGFIRFFDKMATREGYVNGLSWFRTHPPFYERMVEAQREILYLPPLPKAVVQTTEFREMKKELVKVTEKAAEGEKDRPSLLAPEQGCPAPEKIEYRPGEPIETICSFPAQSRRTE